MKVTNYQEETECYSRLVDNKIVWYCKHCKQELDQLNLTKYVSKTLGCPECNRVFHEGVHFIKE